AAIQARRRFRSDRRGAPGIAGGLAAEVGRTLVAGRVEGHPWRATRLGMLDVLAHQELGDPALAAADGLCGHIGGVAVAYPVVLEAGPPVVDRIGPVQARGAIVARHGGG